MLMEIEESIFYFFHDTCRHATLDYLMPILTELASGKFLFVVALCMLLFRRKRVKISAILLMAGMTLSYNVVKVLKHLIARPRPPVALPEVEALLRTGGFALPSGHASMAFMAAAILTSCFGKWYIFYTFATIVAISRVYCGVHFPLDVVAGAFLGTFIGYALVYIASSTKVYSEKD